MTCLFGDLIVPAVSEHATRKLCLMNEKGGENQRKTSQKPKNNKSNTGAANDEESIEVSR